MAGLFATAFFLVWGPGAGAATPDGYTISIGDELELDILDDSDPPQRFTVGGDGQVQLPFIGGVRVEAVTLGAARDLIRDTYVAREIFVTPTIELSIASFRPVFVLGDVRSPGNYDFQPFLTAEQAAGLAGGAAVSANNEEQRVLERRNLAGSLIGMTADLARLATQYARVQAQLANRQAVSWSDVPEAIRADVDRTLFDEMKPAEDQIIVLEDQNYTGRHRLLSDAIVEAEKRIELIEQRQKVLGDAVERGRAELARNRDLVDRGLRTMSVVIDKEQEFARLEGEFLRLREEQSAALVQINTLRSDLSQLKTDREKALLSAAQGFWSEIARLRANRASVEDRLMLLSQWISRSTGPEAELLVEYQVRRRTSAGVQQIALDPFDELLPGDLLMVRIKPPEALADKGVGP